MVEGFLKADEVEVTDVPIHVPELPVSPVGNIHILPNRHLLWDVMETPGKEVAGDHPRQRFSHEAHSGYSRKQSLPYPDRQVKVDEFVLMQELCRIVLDDLL